MSTQDEIVRACADLDAGHPVDLEAGRRVAELARAMVQTDAGAALLKRRGVLERDRLLLDLAAQHFADLRAIRAKARAILTAATRYQASGWRHEQHATSCPTHRIGKPEALIWQALKASPSLPSDTVLRDLLASAGF